MSPEAGTAAPLASRVIEEWWAVLGGPDIRESPATSELRRRLAFELHHAYRGEIPDPPHTGAEAAARLKNDSAGAAWAALLVMACSAGSLHSPRAPRPPGLTPRGVKRVLAILGAQVEAELDIDARPAP